MKKIYKMKGHKKMHHNIENNLATQVFLLLYYNFFLSLVWPEVSYYVFFSKQRFNRLVLAALTPAVSEQHRRWLTHDEHFALP